MPCEGKKACLLASLLTPVLGGDGTDSLNPHLPHYHRSRAHLLGLRCVKSRKAGRSEVSIPHQVGHGTKGTSGLRRKVEEFLSEGR